MAALIEKFDHAAESASSSREDLKRRLVDHLDMLKHPKDVVRVTQVSRQQFRVNTMSPTLTDDSLLSTYRISKSQFLHVEDKHGELVITDQTRH